MDDDRLGRTAIVLAALRPFTAVNGRPVVHRSLQYLLQAGFRRVIVGVPRGETRLPRFLMQAFGSQLSLEFVTVGEDKGPGFTLLSCLRRLAPTESSLVVLGDTLFRFPGNFPGDGSCSFVLTHPVPDAGRWCLAEVHKSNNVERLADKPKSNPGAWPALIGVYYFHSIEVAREALEAELSGGTKTLEMHHALQPYICAGKLDAYTAGEWLDCGNPDMLTSSRRTLLQSREFNDIEVDELRGTITKRSSRRAKFLTEINYYRQLPGDVATFFPRLVDFSLLADDTFMKLEYYGCGTLSEYWVFAEHSGTQWEMVFESLERMMGLLGRYTVDLSTSATFNFYWTKTLERVWTFSQQSPEFMSMVAAEVLDLNGQKLRGWPVIMSDLEDRVRGLSSRTAGQLIHGDLCFPNILYDRFSNTFKFIDPRGNFGEAGIFGDSRYDAAKLLHSIDGGYDFLIHEMFTFNRNGDQFTLQQFFPENRPQVLSAFDLVFGKRFDLAELRLLEGLLFLSMCPLHQENPTRQMAMFMIGLRLTNETLSS